jgi:hypothetical protein
LEERVGILLIRTLPERIKQWYKTKSNKQALHLPSSSKRTNNMVDRKINVKAQAKMTHVKAKDRLTKEIKGQVSTSAAVGSLKQEGGRKGSLLKSRLKMQQQIHQDREHSKVIDNTINSTVKTSSAFTDPETRSSVTKYKRPNTTASKDEKEKTKISSQISSKLKSGEQQKDTTIATHNQPVKSSSSTRTDVFNISNISKPQGTSEAIEKI